MSEPQNPNAEKPETEITESDKPPAPQKLNRRESIGAMFTAPSAIKNALAIEGVLKMPVAAILKKAADVSFLPLLKKAADLGEEQISELIEKFETSKQFLANPTQLKAVEDVFTGQINRAIQEGKATLELKKKLEADPKLETIITKLEEAFNAVLNTNKDDIGYFDRADNYIEGDVESQRVAAIDAAKYIIKKSATTEFPLNETEAELYLKIVATAPTADKDYLGAVIESKENDWVLNRIESQFACIAYDYESMIYESPNIINPGVFNTEINKIREYALGATKKAFPELADRIDELDKALRQQQIITRKQIEACNKVKQENAEREQDALEEKKNPLVSSEKLVQEIFTKEGLKWAERKKDKAIETAKAR